MVQKVARKKERVRGGPPFHVRSPIVLITLQAQKPVLPILKKSSSLLRGVQTLREHGMYTEIAKKGPTMLLISRSVIKEALTGFML